MKRIAHYSLSTRTASRKRIQTRGILNVSNIYISGHTEQWKREKGGSKKRGVGSNTGRKGGREKGGDKDRLNYYVFEAT